MKEEQLYYFATATPITDDDGYIWKGIASMDIYVDYKTPEKGPVEHKELDLDTEIKFIPDYELIDEEETEELEDYFAKLNGIR